MPKIILWIVVLTLIYLIICNLLALLRFLCLKYNYFKLINSNNNCCEIAVINKLFK